MRLCSCNCSPVLSIVSVTSILLHGMSKDKPFSCILPVMLYILYFVFCAFLIIYYYNVTWQTINRHPIYVYFIGLMLHTFLSNQKPPYPLHDIFLLHNVLWNALALPTDSLLLMPHTGYILLCYYSYIAYELKAPDAALHLLDALEDSFVSLTHRLFLHFRLNAREYICTLCSHNGTSLFLLLYSIV